MRHFNLFDLIIITALIIFIFSIILAVFKKFFQQVTVFEYEKGLLYKNGKFVQILDSGRYWANSFEILNFSTNYNDIHGFRNNNVTTLIKKVDMRPSNMTINAQEILSIDNISLKITLVTKFEIIDPLKVINSVQSFYEDLYLQSQIALREIIGSTKIDYLLENRNEINTTLNDIVSKKAIEAGVKIHFISIKDIIFPGELKQVFAQVVKAQKEGQALLEKARGETASIRNLVNASKILDENPSLIYLRMLQALGESKGNTLVLGSDFEKLISKDNKNKNN